MFIPLQCSPLVVDSFRILTTMIPLQLKSNNQPNSFPKYDDFIAGKKTENSKIHAYPRAHKNNHANWLIIEKSRKIVVWCKTHRAETMCSNKRKHTKKEREREKARAVMLFGNVWKHEFKLWTVCKLKCLLVVLCFIIVGKVNKLISYLSEANFFRIQHFHAHEHEPKLSLSFSLSLCVRRPNGDAGDDEHFSPFTQPM